VKPVPRDAVRGCHTMLSARRPSSFQAFGGTVSSFKDRQPALAALARGASAFPRPFRNPEKTMSDVDTVIRHPEWYGALTLQERIALWRGHGSPDPVPGFDAALADWRLGAWREQRPFEDPAVFSERLAALGMDPDEFRALLGAPASTLRDWCGEVPGWLVSLGRILAAEPGHLPAELSMPESSRGMLEVFTPFVTDARARLSALAAEIADGRETPFAPDTAPLLLLGSLLTRILTVVGRVLTLELHIARMQGELEGETPEARFGSFVARLRRPEHLQTLLREYPVLARTLVCQADQWVETGAELLRRLADDQELLRRELNGGEPLGQLARVSNSGVGDLHRGGRAVAIMDFSSGLRVVYKPRSLAVDRVFYDLVAWLNGAGGCPPLRILNTLDRGSHGWVEFAHAGPCADRGEVERYYERLGGLLALLYALDGQDMHMENIVAAGEQPTLVDLETLLHPLGDELLLDDALVSPDPLHPEPVEILSRSVLKVALLPQRIWGDDEGAGGIDLSGVGGAGNQVASTRALRLENGGSDEMRFTRAQVVMQAAHNQPRLAGGEITPAEYVDAIDRGFAGVYRSLAARRGELEAGGLLDAFGDIPLRVVMRMTRTYGSLQRESFHPDFLRDGVDMDRFLDQLWFGAGPRGGLKPLIPHEQDALHRGDIPVFFAVAGSRDLLPESGAVFPDYFAKSGMARVRERIRSLSPEDLERQRLFVRAAMATLVEHPLVPSGRAPSRPAGSPAGSGPPAPAELVRRAEEVGDRLAALALRGSRLAGWIHLTTMDGIRSLAGLSRYDLHGGLPGIVVFLARLGEVARTDRHDGLGRAAFALLSEFLHDGEVLIHDTGGYSGLGGVLPALAVAGERWPDLPAPFLAERVIDRIDAVCADQRRCDLFGGLAGGVAGLLAYHQSTGAERALETALRCGERILALAVDGKGLPFPAGHPGPAGSGFAFGGAGVAWSLLRLSRAAGEERFRALALELLDDAWRRWHRGPREAATEGTWCYGAPGLVLALAAAHESGDAPPRALERAVAATLQAGFTGASHAPCNGTLGALDALLEAAPLLRGPEVAVRIGVESRLLLDSVRRDGWRCGVPLGLETPGLMNGLAGMGYGLLRLARPDLVPSMLTLGLRAAATEAHAVGAPALDAP
jgi:type 2 lantibiotic biosynthesis protein LanM